MGTDGGFRMAPGEHARIQRDLDAAAHRRIREARARYNPIDYNAQHRADTLVILAGMLIAGGLVAAAVLYWTEPAMRFVR